MKNQAIFLLMLISITSHSQKLYYGFKAGVIYSCERGKSAASINKNSVMGITAGGFLGYSLTKNLSAQIELIYSQRGYGFHHGHTFAGGNDGEFIYKINYFDIPLLLKFSVGNKISPYIIAGISPSIFISGKNIMVNEPYPNANLKGYINTMNLGITGGFGLELKISEKLVPFMEARYYNGTSQLYRNTIPNFPPFHLKYFINSICLMGGIRF